MYIFYFFLLSFSGLIFSESSLEKLIDGNKRYAEDKSTHANISLERRQAVIAKQEPFAIIVGCSDSRVSPEIIFDQGVGDLFVVRVAGNVVGQLELESINYAIEYLHSNILIVLGHQSCGAVKAVVENKTESLPSLAKLIAPSVKQEKYINKGDLLENSIKANAINMSNYLNETETIKQFKKNNNLIIKAAYYNLDSGLIELLN